MAVEGMTCASCVGRVERAIKAVPGVTEADVKLATERASVRASASATASNLIEARKNAGYEAREVGPDSPADDAAAEQRDAEANKLKRDLLIAAALAAPVFVLEMGSQLIPGVHELIVNTIGTQTNWLLQFAFTTIVLFGPGLRFYTQGMADTLQTFVGCCAGDTRPDCPILSNITSTNIETHQPPC